MIKIYEDKNILLSRADIEGRCILCGADAEILELLFKRNMQHIPSSAYKGSPLFSLRCCNKCLTSLLNSMNAAFSNKLNDKDIEFLKTLLIKLDVSIEAQRNKVTDAGVALLFDFTEQKRRESILRALDILSKKETLHDHDKELVAKVLEEVENAFTEYLPLKNRTGAWFYGRLNETDC